jgi:hypothetical protein
MVRLHPAQNITHKSPRTVKIIIYLLKDISINIGTFIWHVRRAQLVASAIKCTSLPCQYDVKKGHLEATNQ